MREDHNPGIIGHLERIREASEIDAYLAEHPDDEPAIDGELAFDSSRPFGGIPIVFA